MLAGWWVKFTFQETSTGYEPVGSTAGDQPPTRRQPAAPCSGGREYRARRGSNFLVDAVEHADGPHAWQLGVNGDLDASTGTSSTAPSTTSSRPTAGWSCST